MALDPILNFAKGTVSTGYDDADVTIVLESGHGANFPSSFSYNVVWWNNTDYADPADDPNKEIVRVTARSTDTLTVTRAQEGTSASTKNTAGKTYRMILAFTKKMLDDMVTDIGNAGLPSGTKALFKQASAPTGWTIDDTITDKSAVRYTRGASYGADAGSVDLATGVSTTQGHSLSTAELATHNHSHSHTINRHTGGSGASIDEINLGTGSTPLIPVTATDATNAGSGTAHSHDIELRYTDVIVATKD